MCTLSLEKYSAGVHGGSAKLGAGVQEEEVAAFAKLFLCPFVGGVGVFSFSLSFSCTPIPFLSCPMGFVNK